MALSPASSAGGAAGGSEVGYDQITATVNITGTTSAAPTTVITCAAHTFSGAAVVLTVACPVITFGSTQNNFVTVTLWESGAQLGVLWQASQPSAAAGGVIGMLAQYRFTPAAGAHTYLIRAWTPSTAGTPQFSAGNGGTGNNSYLPAFARFAYA